MPEHARRFDKPWMNYRMPREWAMRINTMAELTEPFEELYVEASKKQDPQTAWAIQSIFCGSTQMHDTTQEVIGLARNIANDRTAASERGKRQRTLKKEMGEVSAQLTYLRETTGKIASDRPLLRLLMSEVSLLRQSDDLHGHIAAGKNFATINHAIEQLPESRTKQDLRNIFNWIRLAEFHSTFKTEGKGTSPLNPESVAYQPLYASYAWKGGFNMTVGHYEGMPFFGTAQMDPTRNPWVMGSATYTVVDLEAAANISYVNELTAQGCYFLPLREILRNDGLYEFLKGYTFRAIDSAVTKGLIREYVPEKERSEGTPMQEAAETPSIALSTALYEKPSTTETRETRKEMRVPALLYRDYSSFFEACGAKLVGGGKHLRFECNGKSVSALNHDTGRVIESAEIMQKLAHLGIPEEVYVEKIPGSAGKDLLARYKKTQK